jgi:hypothetical protein
MTAQATARGERRAGRRVAPQAARAPPDRMGAVEIAPQGDLQPDAGAPAALFGELQHEAIEADGVVARDGPHFFVTENLVQIDGAERHEGGRGIGRRPRELRVEGGQEVIAQIAVRGRQRADTGDAQLVHEPVLQRAIHALAPAARVGRVPEEVLDAQPLQGASDLGGPAPIRPRPRARRIHGPLGAIGVEGDGHAVGLEHAAQGRHDGHHGFAARDELGVEQALRRVIHHGDQCEVRIRHEGQPRVAAAVEVQQFPEAGARLAAAAVAAARPALGQPPRLLEHPLHKRVAQRHVVLAARELIEVAAVEAGVAIAVEPQDAFDLGHRGCASGRV